MKKKEDHVKLLQIGIALFSASIVLIGGEDAFAKEALSSAAKDEVARHGTSSVIMRMHAKAPGRCDADQRGALVMTSLYQLCACNGSSWQQIGLINKQCQWHGKGSANEVE